MSTDLETRLRHLLETRAATITEADLTPAAPADPPARALPPTTAHRRGAAAALPVAAALLLILVAVAMVAGRDRRAATGPPADSDVRTASSTGRAWPLTADQPLPAGAKPEDLATPEAAARAYLRDVVGLDGWPIGDVSVTGTEAVVRYVLQDVPAEIRLAQAPEGAWYVTAAASDLVRPGAPVLTDRGVDVAVGPGPRTYGSGSPVRLSAVAADGRALATTTVRAPPAPAGGAAAAPIASLTWADPELPAAVRADVLDDHDANPSTPDAVVGHWTAAIAGPEPFGLPAGFDLARAEPVHTAVGSADAVAEAYLRARFPDYPAPGVTAQRARTRSGRTYVAWSSGSEREALAAGLLVLRPEGSGWAVVAATTTGVDLTDVRRAGSRLQGRIRTQSPNSLSADVLDEHGQPVPGSPRPEGFPGAAYRYGTAAGPAHGELDLDIEAADPVLVLRVNLVGGTLLSITELRIPPP